MDKGDRIDKVLWSHQTVLPFLSFPIYWSDVEPVVSKMQESEAKDETWEREIQSTRNTHSEALLSGPRSV